MFTARQTCTLYWFYIEVSTLLCTLPRRKARPNLPLRSSAILHVIGPDAGLAPPSSESAFSVVLVRPDGRPMRPSRRGPSHRHVVPACQCLRRGVTACPGRAPYNHFVPVVWSGRGPACQQLASAAESSVSIS